MKKGSERTFALIWAAIMIAVISSTATLLLAGRSTGAAGMHWVTGDQYEMIERYGRLEEVRQTMLTQYYEPLDEDALILGAIRGMTGAADDVYTFYYTPEEMQKEQENEEGVYRGIGVLVGQNGDGYIEVLRVYASTPAEQAGIQVGDIITGVDGTEINTTFQQGYDEAVNMIRGVENTEVLLTIRRGEETLEVPVMRSNVNISYVEYTMLDGGIGYVAISQFMGDAADGFQQALDYFMAHDARGMVIDLRNNPGGLLNVVNRIADSVLPEGIIVYVQDREGKRTDYYSDEKMVDLPLVVLVNDMSASASELFAASVQALGRGAVVGVTTYGKGIVQTVVPFPQDGAGMQLTTASYFDANGRSIHKVGVVPDVEVALDGDLVPVDPDPVSDNQLSRAIEVLEGEIAETERDAA